MFSVYGGGHGFAARLCNEEKDKENPGANSSLGANIPFAADDEWYPHIFKDSQSNEWRMSYKSHFLSTPNGFERLLALG